MTKKHLVLAISAVLYVQLSSASAVVEDTCPVGETCVPDLALLQKTAEVQSTRRLAETPSPQAEGSGHLPTAYQADKVPPYTFSAAQSEAGKKLLQSTGGTLAVEAMYAMDQLFRYWARTLQNVSHTTTLEKPDKEKMKGLFSTFCASLAAVDAGHKCSENPLDIQAGFNAARCLIEKEVDAGFGDAAVLALLTESEDQIDSPIMKDFFNYFQEVSDEVVVFHCDGEDVQTPAPDQALAATRQSKAVGAAGQARRAAEGMVDYFAKVAESASAHVYAEELSRLWQKPCEALGCDAHSWLDIVDALNGHAKELAEVAAPARVLRDHLASSRSAHRALQQGMNLAIQRSKNLEKNGTYYSFAAFMTKHGQSKGSMMYEKAIKDAGGVLDAAFASLRGSKMPLTRWWWCVSVTAGTVEGYAISGQFGWLTLGMDISLSNTFDIGNIEKILGGQGGGLSWSRSATLAVTFIAGLGFSPGCTIGLTASFSAQVSTSGASFSIGLGASGGCMVDSYDCIVGPYLGPFGCEQGVSVGIGIWCCKIDLMDPSKSDCF